MYLTPLTWKHALVVDEDETGMESSGQRVHDEHFLGSPSPSLPGCAPDGLGSLRGRVSAAVGAEARLSDLRRLWKEKDWPVCSSPD